MNYAPLIIFGTVLFLATTLGSFTGGIWVAPEHWGDTEIVIPRGASILAIARQLGQAKVIKDPFAFLILVRWQGIESELSAGRYRFTSGMPLARVVAEIRNGEGRRDVVRLRIIEGMTNHEIFALLEEEGIVIPRELDRVRLFREEFAFLPFDGERTLEGFLFPDTYVFHDNIESREVIKRLLHNFENKVVRRQELHLQADSWQELFDIIRLASLIEKEVPDPTERAVVAGILARRLDINIPLQVDATICYIKSLRALGEGCLPISANDLRQDHPYNTYQRIGLPPGPIANPGLGAIAAALSPRPSPYWYYLSDPKTKRTIFSVSSEEHQAAKRRYLAP